MARIWIAIPTFRRPGPLRHLLGTLPAIADRHDVMLLVADNDPVGQVSRLSHVAQVTGEPYSNRVTPA